MGGSGDLRAAATVCSPKQRAEFDKNKTCFTRKALVSLIETYNQRWATAAAGPGPITYSPRATARDLWGKLNARLFPECSDPVRRDGCWVDTIYGQEAGSSDRIGQLPDDAVIPEPLRDMTPRRPDDWATDPHKWLTNFDIASVMRQYEFADAPEYRYDLIGVYPIDFEGRDGFGTCLFEEICRLNVATYWRRGIRYLGLITNLDNHTQSGSHWTSLFICMDPEEPCYGAYYYDSVGRPMPREVAAFAERIRGQLSALHGAAGAAATFRIAHSMQHHQKEDSECGVFTLNYQIRWLEALRAWRGGQRRRAPTFEDIIRVPLNDRTIHAFRRKYFRGGAASRTAGGAASRTAGGA